MPCEFSLRRARGLYRRLGFVELPYVQMVARAGAPGIS